MNSKDFIADSAIYEAPVDELAHRLPSLKKHDYTTIDDLVRKVSEKHSKRRSDNGPPVPNRLRQRSMREAKSA